MSRHLSLKCRKTFDQLPPFACIMTSLKTTRLIGEVEDEVCRGPPDSKLSNTDSDIQKWVSDSIFRPLSGDGSQFSSSRSR